MNFKELRTHVDRKSLLDRVYYKIGKQKYNFEVCTLYGSFGTEWKPYLLAQADESLMRVVNNRTILPNEIVLDIEDPEFFEDIFELIKKEFEYYHAYRTGSRGYHIHLFFDRDLSKDEKLLVIQKYGCDETKANQRSMIALEGCPHWKTGNIKTLIKKRAGYNLAHNLPLASW